MVVGLTEREGPVLREARDFKALKVEAPSSFDETALSRALGALGSLDDAHAWLSIPALKAMGPSEPAWPTSFDAMIAYAERAGWVSANKMFVRAHVERT